MGGQGSPGNSDFLLWVPNSFEDIIFTDIKPGNQVNDFSKFEKVYVISAIIIVTAISTSNSIVIVIIIKLEQSCPVIIAKSIIICECHQHYIFLSS